MQYASVLIVKIDKFTKMCMWSHKYYHNHKYMMRFDCILDATENLMTILIFYYGIN